MSSRKKNAADRAPEYAVLMVETREQWRAWLQEHHATQRGVWLRLARAGSSIQSPGRSEALDAALCYGWIDGQAKPYDADSWLQKFTPRTRKSVWSKRNREHVERLIASNEMQPAGFAAIAAARADGRWDRAYDSPATASIPDDFAAALAAHPRAGAFFATLTGMKRYTFLHRIQTAVRPETRARRIVNFIELLDHGKILER